MRSRIVSCTALIFALLLLGGCSADRENASSSRTVFAMDTAMVMTVYGNRRDAALDAMEAEILREDALFSVDGGEIDLINKGAGEAVEVSADTLAIIRSAKEVSTRTDGALDLTVYPLVRAFGFYDRQYRVPEEEEIEELRKAVGMERVKLTDSTVAIGDNQQIELGAIAKGYLTDRLLSILEEYDIPRAVLSLGGNVLVLGTRSDGTPWRVGIEDPNSPADYIGSLPLSDIAVVTSGDYQRYFEQDGRRYCHIIDPKTGYPAKTDLRSATILSKDATFADALSTALFVKGREGAIAYWREHRDFEMVLIGSDGRIYLTEGISDLYSPRESTAKPPEVIRPN